MSSVKFLRSQMTGAPQLAGQAGSLVALLDACLVNGFGAGTVDSVVIASGIATVTRSAGHPFEIGSVAEIAGATVSGGSINGQKVVLSVTSTTYTFAATGISNQTATGTITHKAAALGWTKPFSGTNLAAYRSANATGTQEYLRVNDTDTRDSRVVGYETMTDINTGTGLFPTATQQSGGLFWTKSTTADATAKNWILVGDDRLFFLAISHGTSGSGFNLWAFGDFNSAKSPDPYGCMICGNNATQSGNTIAGNSNSDLSYISPSTSQQIYVARSSAGIGSAVVMRNAALFPGVAGNIFSGAGAAIFPNIADNGIYLGPVYLSDVSPQVSYRGIVPGMFASFQNIGSNSFAAAEYLTSVTGYSGKTFRAIPNNTGVTFIDITGPWR